MGKQLGPLCLRGLSCGTLFMMSLPSIRPRFGDHQHVVAESERASPLVSCVNTNPSPEALTHCHGRAEGIRRAPLSRV